MAVISGGAICTDIEVYTNADFELVLIMHADEAQTVLLDNTGYDGLMQFKPKNSNKVILELSVANGGIVFGGVDGTLRLFASRTTLANVPEIANAEYDLLVTDTLSITSKLLYGKPLLIDGVSNLP